MQAMSMKWIQGGRAVMLAAVVVAAGLTTVLAAQGNKVVKSDGPVTKTGEVVDLMCYLDHGAKGPGHSGCATKCIKMGGPVGLLTETQEGESQVYLLIGQHEPINDKLTKYAAKKITVRGKLVGRAGMQMIANTQIVQ